MDEIRVQIQKVDKDYLEKHYDAILAGLYPERRERVLSMRRREVAYVSMTAGQMLQDVVEKELQILPSELLLDKNEYGKPSVKGHPDFYFNLSHAGEYVVLAYGKEPMGVDIERIREKLPRIAKKCLTQREYEYVRTGFVINPEEKDATQEERFFRLWTMKEAYLKLTGQGISIPLSSFEVDPDRQEVVGTGYHFMSQKMDSYWITVCAGTVGAIRWEKGYGFRKEIS